MPYSQNVKAVGSVGAAHRRTEGLRWHQMPNHGLHPQSLLAEGSAPMSKAARLLQLGRPPAWRLPAFTQVTRM